MQREGDRAVGGVAGFVVAVQHLDVDVLVERAGQAVAGGGDDAPAPAVLGGKRDGRIVRRIAQAEQRQCFERTIEDDASHGWAPFRGQSHGG